MDASIIVWVLLGVLLNALVLYVVVRLAARHGIADADRDRAAREKQEASISAWRERHANADGR